MFFKPNSGAEFEIWAVSCLIARLNCFFICFFIYLFFVSLFNIIINISVGLPWLGQRALANALRHMRGTDLVRSKFILQYLCLTKLILKKWKFFRICFFPRYKRDDMGAGYCTPHKTEKVSLFYQTICSSKFISGNFCSLFSNNLFFKGFTGCGYGHCVGDIVCTGC